MVFFFNKKKDDKSSANHNAETAAGGQTSESGAGIKVLGTGCAKCRAQEQAVQAAMLELGINEELEHVTDFVNIAAYGVMTTPALVVDGKVVSYGKVLQKDEAKTLIAKARDL